MKPHSDAARTLWTIGRIAEHTGVSLHQVKYVIQSRGIQPLGKAGCARVFDDADVELIATELASIQAKREGASLAK